MFRIQLTSNTPTKNPVAEKVILVDNFDKLKIQASQKFKIKPNKIRLFVAKPLINAKLGTEIIDDNQFQIIVCNDMLLSVSNNEDFKRKILSQSTEQISEDMLSKLKYPPRYPYPSKHDDIVLSNESIENIKLGCDYVDESDEIIMSLADTKSTNNIKEFNGLFPILRGNVLHLIKRIVSTNNKIKIIEENGYISFDYDDNMIFPFTHSWDDALLKECRGLIISSVTGKVLARRFHKFFNIGEKEEFETGVFNNCVAYEKLDGKLITPILRDDKKLIWATRKLRDFEVEEFIKSSNVDYTNFSLNKIIEGVTPIFEYLSNSLPIGIISYSCKNLILIALRNNETGEYISVESERNNVYNVPIVNKVNFENTNDMIEKARKLISKEGFVIYTNSGQIYKCKSKWYMNMVNSQSSGQKMFLSTFVKESKTIKNIPKNKIFVFAIQNYDDEIAEVCHYLLENHKKKEITELKNFIQIVQKNMLLLETELNEWINSSFKLVQTKEAILEAGKNAGWNVNLLNNIFEKKDVMTKLKLFLIQFAVCNKIDILTELLDIDWDSENCKINNENIVMSNLSVDYTFDQINCLNENIIDHVLKKYLQKKISNVFGYKNINSDTIINFHNTYVGNEGKLIGMYESIAEQYNINDLRIDIQDKRKEYSKHYGNDEYVNLLVQSGKREEKSISHAGILIPTNSDFKFSDIVNAMKQSFESNSLVKLRRKVSILKYKIFCDLDGVLVDFDKGVHELTGKPISLQTPQKMWQRIANYSNFFEDLDPTSYGIEMWKEIINISHQIPTILTGVTSGKKYEDGKREWVKKHLKNDNDINDINVIVCNSSDKYKYASINHILIDDRLEMGRPWIANGGIFIHHINPNRTLHKLRELFDCEQTKKHHLDFVETDELDDYKNDCQIEFIVDNWEEITDNIISLDSEWKYNDQNCQISIIQIATRTKVYIVDLINCSKIVSEQLTELLNNEAITKICFGLSEDESNRIGTDIKNVFDIQEILTNSFDNFNKCNIPSLELSTNLILKKKLNKSKEISLSNWNKRPLDENQIKYASNDVTVLFELYDNLIENQLIKDYHNKHIFNEKTVTIKKNREEIKTEIPVKIHSVGIFVSPNSKEELIKNISMNFKNIQSNYVLLQLFPIKNIVDNLGVGKTVQFKITKIIKYSSIQVGLCEFKNMIGHLLISSDSQLIDYNKIYNVDETSNDEIICNFNLFGIIGIYAQQISDDLITLTENVRKKILYFKENAQPCENLKFKAGELSGIERSIIHEYAKNNNMESHSTGKPTDRQLILTMKRKTDNSMIKELINEDSILKQKITNSLQYSVMTIIENNQNNTLTKYYDVAIDSDNNNLIINNKKLENALNYSNKLIILRGLPGSGKSFVTNCNNFLNAKICSADDYFYKGDKYQFNENELSNAHNYCYNLCVEYLHNKKNTIIIDNTNSTLKEFKKYIDAGNSYNYMIIVLELKCNNTEQAIKFNERCVHGVPIKTELIMFNRWEKYDKSYTVKPFEENKKNKLVNQKSLNSWLSDNKLIHTSKFKNKSHMIMAVGNQPIMFLDICNKLYEEFCQKYSDAIDNEENLYIMEYCSRFPKFKFVVDFDYVDENELSKEEIFNFGIKLQQILISFGYIPDVYIIGNIYEKEGKIKSGLHFRCPNCLVSLEEAQNISNKYVELLTYNFHTKNWLNIVDTTIYKENCGIRMFGSKKANTNVRHKLLLILNENGEEVINDFTTYELVKILSIYNK